MNWLLVLVLVLIGFYAWRGKKRGFIRTVFTMFSTIIAIVITLWISPHVTSWIQRDNRLINYINERINENVIDENVGETTTDEVKYIEKLPLPSLIKDTLIENKTPDVYDVLSVESFKGYVSNLLAVFLVNIGMFLLLYMIVKILLNIIARTLDLIGNLPIISGLNSTAGLLVGLVHGIMMVWIGFIVITLFVNDEYGLYLFSLINESKTLSTIYNNNLILMVLTDISKVLF